MIANIISNTGIRILDNQESTSYSLYFIYQFIFGEEYRSIFPDRELRTDYSDSDLDKERRFYVLTKTIMPAVLTENFFMDNEEECRNVLLTREGREQIVEFHVNAIA